MEDLFIVSGGQVIGATPQIDVYQDKTHNTVIWRLEFVSDIKPPDLQQPLYIVDLDGHWGFKAFDPVVLTSTWNGKQAEVSLLVSDLTYWPPRHEYLRARARARQFKGCAPRDREILGFDFDNIDLIDLGAWW